MDATQVFTVGQQGLYMLLMVSAPLLLSVLAIGLLVAAILVALAVAARIYATGVLLYGQRPTLGGVVRAARRS